jgi:hypothetical protein
MRFTRSVSVSIWVTSSPRIQQFQEHQRLVDGSHAQSLGGERAQAKDGRPGQALRRWGNSLGIRLPAAIAREAQLQENQPVELSVVEGEA